MSVITASTSFELMYGVHSKYMLCVTVQLLCGASCDSAIIMNMIRSGGTPGGESCHTTASRHRFVPVRQPADQGI